LKKSVKKITKTVKHEPITEINAYLCSAFLIVVADYYLLQRLCQTNRWQTAIYAILKKKNNEI